jgi:hypothetical protein
MKGEINTNMSWEDMANNPPQGTWREMRDQRKIYAEAAKNYNGKDFPVGLASAVPMAGPAAVLPSLMVNLARKGHSPEDAWYGGMLGARDSAKGHIAGLGGGALAGLAHNVATFKGSGLGKILLRSLLYPLAGEAVGGIATGAGATGRAERRIAERHMPKAGHLYKAAEETLDPYWAGKAGWKGKGTFKDYVGGVTGNKLKADEYGDRLQLARSLGWVGGGAAGGVGGHQLTRLLAGGKGGVSKLLRILGAAGGMLGGGELTANITGRNVGRGLAEEHNTGVLGYNPTDKIRQLEQMLKEKSRQIPDLEKALRQQTDRIPDLQRQLQQKINEVTHLGHKGPMQRAGESVDGAFSSVGDYFRNITHRE